MCECEVTFGSFEQAGDLSNNGDKDDDLKEVKNSIHDGNLSEDDGRFVSDKKKTRVKSTVEENIKAEVKEKNTNQTKVEDNRVYEKVNADKLAEEHIKLKVYQEVLETKERVKAIDNMESKDKSKKETIWNQNNLNDRDHFGNYLKEDGQTNVSIQASVSAVKDTSKAKEAKSRKLPGQSSKDDVPSSTLKTAVYTKSSNQKISAQKYPCFLPNKTQKMVSIIVC